MIIPLDKLLDNSDNSYIMTCAAIRRALQITLTNEDEIQKNEGKVVSTAIKQILVKKVEFRIEE